MNVLIACEESQRVCVAFRNRGHNAFSCDIECCSGGHPEWHIKDDCIPLLDGDCDFITVDGKSHTIKGKWDLIIAHPPCTYLSVVGNKYFNVDKYGSKAINRKIMRKEAARFFLKFVNCNCDRVCIENPVGYMNTHYRRADQIIHPYYFGDPYQKRTCLWLRGLPKLTSTHMLEKPSHLYTTPSGKKINWCEGITGTHGGQAGRAKARSKTFPGIANAMAEQWG